MIEAVVITRDQSEYLKRCLGALSAAGIPVTVCDTGSSDDSVEVAKAAGAKVVSFQWNNDFAAAKNYAASMAVSDIILSLDTDEFVEKCDLAALESRVSDKPDSIGRIHIRNRFSYNGEERFSDEYLPRIYDRRNYEFVGRVHEQLRPKSDRAEAAYFDAPVTVLHVGYDLSPEEKEKKAERNLDILLKEAEEFPTDGDHSSMDPDAQERAAYIYYQIGKSHYMAGRFEEAADAFGIGLSYDVDERLDFLRDMVSSYGYALVNAKRIEEALALEGVEETFSDDADFLFVLGLIFMNAGRFDDAVDRFKKAAGMKTSRVEGAASYLAWYNAGVVRECQGMTEEALEYYRKAGDYEPAMGRIKGLKC